MSEGPASQSASTNPKHGSRAGHVRDGHSHSTGDSAPASPAELIPRLQAFLDLVVREMALSVKYEVSEVGESEEEGKLSAAQRDGGPPTEKRASRIDGERKNLMVRFTGEDEEILLARNGELLLALEYLAHRWLHLAPAWHDCVRLECGDFRATRLEELKLSARVAAQRVRETGQPFPFNPMSSRDRRIIHVELNGAPGVRTISEGNGDRRHLVIYPASKR